MGSGFGLVIRRPFFQWCHYDVMHWYLRNLFRESMRVLRLRIVTEGPTPQAFPGDPLIVLSRHAGRATPSPSSMRSWTPTAASPGSS